jgi:DNA-binding NtrC family response regulator
VEGGEEERGPAEGGPYYGVAMREVLLMADKAAATDAPVLLLGETGVGKEELARRIHEKSGREGLFVPVHPASLPEQLFESLLFGHEKGAFTGAHRRKAGLLEVADRGTLFIDELGDIPAPLQVKLLRVLQTRRFLRVGGLRAVTSDFRLISATHQDLEKKAREGAFREDLFYRVAVLPLRIPPLRRRGEDVRRLAELFYARYAARHRCALSPLSAEDLDGLLEYDWPGNVRELKNCIERAVILSEGGRPGLLLRERGLPPPGREGEEKARTGAEAPAPGAALWPGRLPTMRDVQRQYIRYVLTLTGGKVDGEHGAMSILGMKRSTLYAKIREYGLDKASLLYGRKGEERGKEENSLSGSEAAG